MDRIPRLFASALIASCALTACADREADSAQAAPATTDTRPAVDPAIAGAPGDVLPAPSSTAAVPPAGDPGAAYFRKLDADGNGRVTPGEHARGAAAMFAAMDGNDDGEVTAAEMDAVHAAMGDAPMASADRIRAGDANGDGFLGSDEDANSAKMRFATMDTSADGVLDLAEVRAGHDRMPGGAGARPVTVTPN